MKLSVSIPNEELETLDRFVREAKLESRSAGVQYAIRALASRELGDSYAQAWQEWEAGGDAALWDTSAGDFGAPNTTPTSKQQAGE